MPAGFRAAQLPDAGVSIPFLDDFGRPVRESACECERSSGMVLGPILKLINGPTVADALADPGERAEPARRQASRTTRKLIEEVFLRFLARKPTEQELKLGIEALKAAAADQAKAAAALAEYEKQLPAKQAAWEASLGKPRRLDAARAERAEVGRRRDAHQARRQVDPRHRHAGQGRLHDRRAGRPAGHHRHHARSARPIRRSPPAVPAGRRTATSSSAS